MNQGRVKFTYWERLLLLLSSLIFLFSFVFYTLDLSIRYNLLGWERTNSTEPVGEVLQAKGSNRRQRKRQAAFQKIKNKEIVYNLDTLVTGENSSITIMINDGGGKITLEPNTMVRLRFRSSLSLTGVKRTALVDVIKGKASTSGKVKVQRVKRVVRKKVRKKVKKVVVVEKKKEIIKKTYLINLEKPELGEVFKLPDWSKKTDLNVEFRWSLNEKDADLEFVLYQIGKNIKFKAPREIKKIRIKLKNGVGRTRVNLKEYGQYEWIIRWPSGETITNGKSRFEFSRYFKGIRVMEPLVAGEAIHDNLIHERLKKKFDIALRWKDYPKQRRYKVKIFKNQNSKRALMEKNLTESIYHFNKNKILSGKFYYEVSSILKNGFVVESGRHQFYFAFTAPPLVTPLHKEVVSIKKLDREQKVLLTWAKTNFTEGYEIQVDVNPQFKNPHIDRKTKENFFVLRHVKPGKIYWRVRSFNKKLASRYSEVRELIVKP